MDSSVICSVFLLVKKLEMIEGCLFDSIALYNLLPTIKRNLLNFFFNLPCLCLFMGKCGIMTLYF